MKRSVLFTLLFLLGLISTSNVALAQTSDSLLTKATLKENTIFWQKGKLVQLKDGKLHELQEPITYSNGTVVSPNGEVLLSDGKKYTLKEKNAVSPQGRIVLAADDIFTHNAIMEHEKQVVGDTETQIVIVDGKIVSAGNNSQRFSYSTAKEKKIQLLEQMIKLLEQRASLLEANLSPTERRSIKAYYEGLNKQIDVVNQQLQALPPSVR